MIFQINKEKSELMMRTTTENVNISHNYNDKNLIKFGREEINIKAKHPHEPMQLCPRVNTGHKLMALSKLKQKL
ncbi:unnamed protein product [Rhizophagus irregularis]|nr:unnamed protein product [Rhizophagus irregularis]